MFDTTNQQLNIPQKGIWKIEFCCIMVNVTQNRVLSWIEVKDSNNQTRHDRDSFFPKDPFMTEAGGCHVATFPLEQGDSVKMYLYGDNNSGASTCVHPN